MHALAAGVHPQGPAYLFPLRLIRARIIHTAPRKCRVMNIHYFSVTFSRTSQTARGSSRESTRGAVILSHPVIRKRTLFHEGHKSHVSHGATKNTSEGREGRAMSRWDGKAGVKARVHERASNGHDSLERNAYKNTAKNSPFLQSPCSIVKCWKITRRLSFNSYKNWDYGNINILLDIYNLYETPLDEFFLSFKIIIKLYNYKK